MTTAAAVRFPPNTRVRDIVGVYFSYPSPRLLIGILAVSLAGRIVVGQWSWWDLALAAALVTLQPLTEWVIHSFVLHYRPRQIGGRVIDLHLAKEHRRHHRDPKNIAAVFIPVRSLLIGVPIAVLLTLALVPSTGLALTAIVTVAAIGNVYEWTHFYIHSGCTPRNRYARSIERAHRLHHYRNENFWLGVTNNAADHVLGTFPDRDAVPVSPTARTLGIGD